MIYYREDRITRQLFRKTAAGAEEYIGKDKEWRLTAAAIRAFHDSSDTVRITEKEAMENIEWQATLYK